jgi:hypothetical protein
MWYSRLLPVLRLMALMSLAVCVYCKMIDLDCALTQPAHCQTVLEAGDNSFGQSETQNPQWTEPLAAVLDPVQVPRQPLCSSTPWLHDGLPLSVHGPLRWRPQDSKRPPPPPIG